MVDTNHAYEVNSAKPMDIQRRSTYKISIQAAEPYHIASSVQNSRTCHFSSYSMPLRFFTSSSRLCYMDISVVWEWSTVSQGGMISVAQSDETPLHRVGSDMSQSSPNQCTEKPTFGDENPSPLLNVPNSGYSLMNKVSNHENKLAEDVKFLFLSLLSTFRFLCSFKTRKLYFRTPVKAGSKV